MTEKAYNIMRDVFRIQKEHGQVPARKATRPRSPLFDTTIQFIPDTEFARKLDEVDQQVMNKLITPREGAEIMLRWIAENGGDND